MTVDDKTPYPNSEMDCIPRSSMLDIPTEIWGKIVDFSTLSTKKQLCCVSFSFRALGTQKLYREVVLEGGDQALKCCKTLKSNFLAAQSVRIFSVVLPLWLDAIAPYPRFFQYIAETLSTCPGIEKLSIACSQNSLYARKVHRMVRHITFPDLKSVHFATPIRPVFLYGFLNRHRDTLQSVQLVCPDKEHNQPYNERQKDGQFILKQLNGPVQTILPLLSWINAPSLSRLTLSFSSEDTPELILSDVNNAWRPLNVDELHLDLTFYQKQDSVLRGVLTYFSDVVSLRLSTYFDRDLAEFMCKNISSFHQLQALVLSTPDHAVTRYTKDEHAMVVRLGTACPSLQTCQIWTCPIWKRVVDGVWVPGKDSIDAGIFMLEMLSLQHSPTVKRLLQHLVSYSLVYPEATGVTKHFQEADAYPVDETAMKGLLRLGQKLGFWDYAEAFYFDFKPPQQRPEPRIPVPQQPTSVADMFSNEFMQSVANQLKDFETGLFRPNGDINFERDFGQWFNHPDDVGGGLEMK